MKIGLNAKEGYRGREGFR